MYQHRKNTVLYPLKRICPSPVQAQGIQIAKNILKNK